MIRRAEKTHISDDIVFRTKPQIALKLVHRAKTNGICVMAWTADELYGGNSGLLNALDECNEAFVVEIPDDLRVRMIKPEVRNRTPEPL